jgi:hypothetical protein
MIDFANLPGLGCPRFLIRLIYDKLLSKECPPAIMEHYEASFLE